jgi:hypothetical protein
LLRPLVGQRVRGMEQATGPPPPCPPMASKARDHRLPNPFGPSHAAMPIAARADNFRKPRIGRLASA